MMYTFFIGFSGAAKMKMKCFTLNKSKSLVGSSSKEQILF